MCVYVSLYVYITITGVKCTYTSLQSRRQYMLLVLFVRAHLVKCRKAQHVVTVFTYSITFVLPKFWQHLVTICCVRQVYQRILTRRKTYHISQFRRQIHIRARQQASWFGITVYCVRTALSCLQGQTGLTVVVAAEENEVCGRYWEVACACRKLYRLS